MIASGGVLARCFFVLLPRKAALIDGLRQRHDARCSRLSRVRQLTSAKHLSKEQHVASERSGAERDEETLLPEVLAEVKRLGFGVTSYGQYQHINCPKCNGGDKGDKDLSLTVTSERIMWRCFRGKCGYRGSRKLSGGRLVRRYAVPNLALEPLGPDWQAFLKARRISEPVVQRNKLGQQADSRGSPALVFPYYKDGEVVSAKYRTLNKRFWQLKDTEKILYGWDDIKGQREVIIVEGEIDKLSVEEAGFSNVASVPQGAPPEVRETPAPEDAQFAFLRNSAAALEGAQRFILATDNDAPGRALAVELAKRLGPENCMLVNWNFGQHATVMALQRAVSNGPSTAPASLKDANAVLTASGPDAVRACILAAKPFPVPGIVSVSSFADGVLREVAKGAQKVFGLETGWHNLDKLYRIRPGGVTVVSGPPLSGKSEFATALLCRLTSVAGQADPQRKFRSGLFLLETQDLQHSVKRLLEKRVGKPVDGPPAPHSMQLQEAQAGLSWLSEHFTLLSRERNLELTSLESVLELARIATLRNKLDGLLIDSYNWMMPGSSSPGETAALAMRQLRSFAQHHKIHVWLTVHSLHPAEAHYLLLLSDVGLSLQRTAQETVVTVLSNNPSVARPGTASFIFDTKSGQYVPCS